MNRLAISCGTLLVTALTPSNAATQSFQTQTIVAKPPILDALDDGSFEEFGTTFKITSPDGFEDYSSTSVGGWSFGPSCGVAGLNSPFLENAADIPPIDGTQAAYMTADNGYLEYTVTAPAGYWRVRYLAAARSQTSFVDQPHFSVSVSGVRVGFESPDHTQLLGYTTRPFHFSNGQSETIRFQKQPAPDGTSAAQQTAIIDHVRLEQVLEWQEKDTWEQNRLPGADDVVYIGPSSAIGFSEFCEAKGIDCEGDLIALEVTEDTTLEAKWIHVRAAGPQFSHLYAQAVEARLEVGRPEVPYVRERGGTVLGECTIRLMGTSDDPPIGNAGTKVLMAMDGGVIDLHGAEKTSWSRLARTIPKMSSQSHLEAEEASGWQPGDQIVVTGSKWDRSEAARGAGSGLGTQELGYETAVVDTVNASGFSGDWTVTISSSPFQELHLGREAFAGGVKGPQTFTLTDPRAPGPQWSAPPGVPLELDQSVEVANLTRNVKVVGEVVPPEASTGQSFGGHVMVMKCSDCTAAGGFGRFSHVEFWNMGQDTEDGLGRYPVHFHMLKSEGDGQYVHDCSIHQSFNRAITIHGTDHVSVKNNVAFDIQGHAVFLEDGSEMENVIDHNLVIAARRAGTSTTDQTPLEVIESDFILGNFQDRSPASYWITNPYNQVTNNVAADSEGTGFYMIFPRQPLGLSSQDSELNEVGRVVPIKLPFMLDGEGSLFRNNKAHCCRMGLHFNNTVEQPDGDVPGDGYDDDSDASRKIGMVKNTSWIPSRVTSGSDTFNPNDPREPSTEVVNGFTAFGGDVGVYTSTGNDQIRFERLVLADCNRLTDFASYGRVHDSLLIEEGALDRVGANSHLLETAIRIYDGAGRYDNVGFIGFQGDFNGSGGLLQSSGGIFSLRGAATLHPNQEVDRIYFGTVNGDAPGTPFLRFTTFVERTMTLAGVTFSVELPTTTQDPTDANVLVVTDSPTFPASGAQYGSSPIYGHTQNPYAPSKWGGVILDSDGYITDPDGTGSSPVTIVAAHPWHLLGDETDYALSDGVVSYASVSPHRFGQLRLSYFNGNGERERDLKAPGANYNFDITRYVRSIPGSSPPVLPKALRFRHFFNSREHKQINLIVNDAATDLVHEIDHDDANFPGENGWMEITLDDVKPGDRVILRLADFALMHPTELSGRPYQYGTALSTLSKIPAYKVDSGNGVDERLLAEGAQEPCLLFDLDNDEVFLYLHVRTAANGSLPAGKENVFRDELDPVNSETWVYVGSRNQPTSEWRREAIILEW